MKKCPTCDMTVKADTFCPYCQTTLTYEPEVEGKFEKIVLNRYFFIAMLKRFAFVLASIIFCVISALFIKNEYYWYFTIFAGVLSLIVTALQRTMTMNVKSQFFETIIWVFIILLKYVLLLLPVLWGLLYLIFN